MTIQEQAKKYAKETKQSLSMTRIEIREEAFIAGATELAKENEELRKALAQLIDCCDGNYEEVVNEAKSLLK